MAILIKTTSKGPVFFKQNRLGLAGRRFTLYKFRTMRQDAETHAHSDRKRKELIEARNQADNTAYAAEKALKEHEGMLSADLKAEVETRLADLRAKSGAEDIAGIDAATACSLSSQKAAATVTRRMPVIPPVDRRRRSSCRS
jgi:molecular chaperone DnaK (HSP70)